MERSGGGSPAGSEANLTAESLRRRPSHSRKASLESVEDGSFVDATDRLLPALEGVHLGASAGGGGGGGGGRVRGQHDIDTPPKPPPKMTAAPAESVASAAGDAGGGSGVGHGNGAVAEGGDEEPEISSAEKAKNPYVLYNPSHMPASPAPAPPKPSAPTHAAPMTKVKAVVASGGYLVVGLIPLSLFHHFHFSPRWLLWSCLNTVQLKTGQYVRVTNLPHPPGVAATRIGRMVTSTTDRR
jgi:hypothetical protein